MKKWILLISLFVIIQVGLNGLSFADLDIDKQYLVKDFVIDYDEEITEVNFLDLEGIQYEIIYESDDYIIVLVDGKIVIVPTSWSWM